MREGEADGIEPFEQVALHRGVDLEGAHEGAVGSGDRLGFEVNDGLGLGQLLGAGDEELDVRGGEGDGEEADLGAVVAEDIGEGGGR